MKGIAYTQLDNALLTRRRRRYVLARLSGWPPDQAATPGSEPVSSPNATTPPGVRWDTLIGDEPRVWDESALQLCTGGESPFHGQALAMSHQVELIGTRMASVVNILVDPGFLVVPSGSEDVSPIATSGPVEAASMAKGLVTQTAFRTVFTGLRLVLADEGVITGLRPLAELYILREPTRVREFIEAHPDLVGLLIEAHGTLLYHFGSGSELVLEVVSDRDTEEHDATEELFVLVRTALEPLAATSRLDDFEDRWFLGHPAEHTPVLNFDLEFA